MSTLYRKSVPTYYMYIDLQAHYILMWPFIPIHAIASQCVSVDFERERDREREREIERERERESERERERERSIFATR